MNGSMKSYYIKRAVKKVNTILAENKVLARCEYVLVDQRYLDRMTEAMRAFHPMRVGDEQIVVYHDVDGRMLYNVNVTGDNVLTAIGELMGLLAKKF